MPARDGTMARNLPFQEQTEIHILFEEEDVGRHKRDLVAGNEIVVELKAVKAPIT